MNGVLIVTGGSRGIGAATARLAAGHGWDVCVGYRAEGAAAAEVVHSCEAHGVKALAVQTDVSIEADIVRLFEAADAADLVAAVDRLNALLRDYPVQPQLSGHDGTDWHLHLAEGAASVAAAYATVATMGLAVFCAEYGVNRLGVCQAPPCRKVFLDTSTNRSRRYCSDRCATRANVAAYRQRRRDQASLPVA